MTKPRQIRVRGLRRDRVDAAKLGRALIELAQAQREKEARAEHERWTAEEEPGRKPPVRNPKSPRKSQQHRDTEKPS